MKTVVYYHNADFDGLFCRAIAEKFLPANVEFIGWDFSMPSLSYPHDADCVYVLDLPFQRQIFEPALPEPPKNLVWIDHHASSIKEAGRFVRGYQIDGVAACRLAWHWFAFSEFPAGGLGPKYLPVKEQFVSRQLREPKAVTLAGEYDVWQHEPSGNTDIDFQYGLRAQEELDWNLLLQTPPYTTGQGDQYIAKLLQLGQTIKRYHDKTQQEVGKKYAFEVNFEGLTFIAINTQARNSFAIDFMAKPEHDGLMTFSWTGKEWRVSMYGNGKDIDLSEIAKKHGGGGHKNACGFQARWLPWLPS